MNDKITYSKWNMTDEQIVELGAITPEIARDLLVVCFANAQKEMLAKKPEDRPSASDLVKTVEQGDLNECSTEPQKKVSGTPKKSFKRTYTGIQMPVHSGSDEPNREITDAIDHREKNLFRLALLGRVGAGKTALIRAMNSNYVGYACSGKTGDCRS